jgi:alkanesulfonate monooxygenase SsuD/methylene tetrahydromethanopterin reductase-like flavin-dependent oxidoreductase (luciferase family)
MQASWARGEAEFHGQFVDCGPIFSWPKPARVPHLPVPAGGSGPLGQAVC